MQDYYSDATLLRMVTFYMMQFGKISPFSSPFYLKHLKYFKRQRPFQSKGNKKRSRLMAASVGDDDSIRGVDL
jgi:hypothetical protein